MLEAWPKHSSAKTTTKRSPKQRHMHKVSSPVSTSGRQRTGAATATIQPSAALRIYTSMRVRKPHMRRPHHVLPLPGFEAEDTQRTMINQGIIRNVGHPQNDDKTRDRSRYRIKYLVNSHVTCPVGDVWVQILATKWTSETVAELESETASQTDGDGVGDSVGDCVARRFTILHHHREPSTKRTGTTKG